MKAGTWFLVTLIVCSLTAAVAAELVACVGDSIAYGAGISDRMYLSTGHRTTVQREISATTRPETDGMWDRHGSVPVL